MKSFFVAIPIHRRHCITKFWSPTFVTMCSLALRAPRHALCIDVEQPWQQIKGLGPLLELFSCPLQASQYLLWITLKCDFNGSGLKTSRMVMTCGLLSLTTSS